MPVPTPQAHKDRKTYTDLIPKATTKVAFIKKRRAGMPLPTYFGLENRDANRK